MAQWYDKIIRENVEQVVGRTVFSMLKINPLRIESVSPTIHSTIKRDPDFLKKVWLQDKPAPFLVHIEFQSKPDSEMIYRMVEYRGLLARKFKLPVLQYVVYLGQEPWKYTTELSEQGLRFSFELIWLRSYSISTFLRSNTPEIVLAGIFSDFKNEKKRTVVKSIIEKLFKLSESDADFQKYLTQLKVLSKLVRLQDVVLEEIKTMPITYDIKKDILYQQGMQQGMQQGIEEGVRQARLATVQKLKQEGLSSELISRVTGLSVSEIHRLSSNPKAE